LCHACQQLVGTVLCLMNTYTPEINSPLNIYNSFMLKGIVSIILLNKRPMGHIAHLSNLGPYDIAI
jgi:hypothetical protein